MVGESELLLELVPRASVPGVDFVRWLGAPGTTTAFAGRVAGGDALVKPRALREAELLRRLSHPAIVKLVEARERSESIVLLSELVLGETLAALLARGALEVARAVEIGATVAAALAHAHARGVVHRDVAPQNIWIEERAPFAGVAAEKRIAAAKRGVKPLRALMRVSPSLEELVLGCLCPRPAERPAAAQVERALGDSRRA